MTLRRNKSGFDQGCTQRHGFILVDVEAGNCSRPTGVRPMSSGPAQRKCRLHFWRRGLNKGTVFRDRLSRPEMFGPLKRLQHS